MNEHEAGFLTFIEQPQQRRLKALFDLGEKRRREVRSLLHHAIRLDARYCKKLPGGDQFAPRIEEILRQRGAPETCFVIAVDPTLDGRILTLREALEAIIGSSNGAFVSSIPGKLGYFEYEDASSGRLLFK